VENCYVFKSRLQEYAQKAGLMAPEYQTLKEGPSHEPVFRSTVLINNAKYESLPGFFSRKAAEQSAAEVALMEIGKSAAVATNASIPAVVSLFIGLGFFSQVWLCLCEMARKLSVCNLYGQKRILCST
jgi:hypothetical protein